MTSGCCARATAAQATRTTASSSRIGLFASNRHPVDEDRAARAPAAREDVGSDRDDALEHVAQIAGDGDFLHRELDLAAVDPVARGAARVIAGDEVDSMAEELRDEEPAAH